MYTATPSPDNTDDEIAVLNIPVNTTYDFDIRILNGKLVVLAYRNSIFIVCVLTQFLPRDAMLARY